MYLFPTGLLSQFVCCKKSFGETTKRDNWK